MALTLAAVSKSSGDVDVDVHGDVHRAAVVCSRDSGVDELGCTSAATSQCPWATAPLVDALRVADDGCAALWCTQQGARGIGDERGIGRPEAGGANPQRAAAFASTGAWRGVFLVRSHVDRGQSGPAAPDIRRARPLDLGHGTGRPMTRRGQSDAETKGMPCVHVARTGQADGSLRMRGEAVAATWGRPTGTTRRESPQG